MMKNVFKRIISFLMITAVLLGMLTVASACGGDDKKKKELSEFKTPDYQAYAMPFEDMPGYEGEVYVGSESQQANLENGVIISPYLTCKVNGKEVNVYASRCTNGAHSYGYVDVIGNDDIYLEVELTLAKSRQTVVVLPLNKGVTPTMEGKTVTATIESTGSFSFAFNDEEARAFTLIVKRADEFQAPDGYEVRYFEPGTYTKDQTNFKDQNVVYYFKPGEYNISGITAVSNTIVYCDYAHFKMANDNVTGYATSATENVQLIGRSLWDFSNINMKTTSKSPYRFDNVKNIRLEGVTCVNSCSWTFCFTRCANAEISNITGFSYRTFTDGIMIANSKDMHVYDSFMRTGDDAFEVKSTSTGEMGNILYEDCHAWNDKAVAFGVIYEMNESVHDVHFKNCSVGFNMPVWDVTRGAASICMDDYEKGLTNERITFTDFEIYYSLSRAVALCLHSGTLKDIKFENFVVHKDYTEFPVYIRYNAPYIGRVPTDKQHCQIINVEFNNFKVQGKDLTFDMINNPGWPDELYIDGVKYEG